jgi:hypothetical protein
MTADLGAGGDGRAQVILLALSSGRSNRIASTPKDAWRHPGADG